MTSICIQGGSSYAGKLHFVRLALTLNAKETGTSNPPVEIENTVGGFVDFYEPGP
jgi:hypothetical protein